MPAHASKPVCTAGVQRRHAVVHCSSFVLRFLVCNLRLHGHQCLPRIVRSISPKRAAGSIVWERCPRRSNVQAQLVCRSILALRWRHCCHCGWGRGGRSGRDCDCLFRRPLFTRRVPGNRALALRRWTECTHFVVAEWSAVGMYIMQAVVSQSRASWLNPVCWDGAKKA